MGRARWRVPVAQAAWVAIGTSILFMVLYGGVSYLTDLRSDVGTWYYDWERFIPFVPVMIVPYMSIDLFFLFAPFFCRNRNELRILAQRLSAVIVGAAVCFLIYPLQLAVERPEVSGFFGSIYNWFTALDRPYNLCPSMHIALRTVLAAHYARYCRQRWLHVAVNFWFFLIGCSTLLVYQHHVIDVVGGFVLASLVMYAFDGLPWRLPKVGGMPLGVFYATLAVVLIAPLYWVPRLGWLTLWPAVACGFVSIGYLWAGPSVYRRFDGRLTWPARWVLGPVLAGQWLSWLYYARQSSAIDHVADGVSIGRHLSESEAQRAVAAGIGAVVDCCNAFSEPPALREIDRLELPILDLTAPTSDQLESAVQFIEQHRAAGVLVHCKAGYSRSAGIVAGWLMATGRAGTADDAIAMLRSARPNIVIRPEIHDALRQWQQRINEVLIA